MRKMCWMILIVCALCLGGEGWEKIWWGVMDESVLEWAGGVVPQDEGRVEFVFPFLEELLTLVKL